MGDPKKLRKKYETPIHPWIKKNIDEDKILRRDYGLRNKRELLKISSFLKKYKNIAKRLTTDKSAQGEHEKALSYAQEALTITERSGYVLQGADVNLFLAELALEGIGEKMTSEGVTSEELAREYAEKALQLAHCDDGPPYHYKVAYEEAQALLEKLKE